MGGLRGPLGGIDMSKLYDLTEMKRRLAAIDAERDPLVRLIEAAEAYEGKIAQPAPAAERVTFTVRARPRPMGIGAGTPPSGRQMTVDVAEELIEASGKPVQTREVLDVMAARGMPMPTKNVINVISARLSNSGRFDGRRGVGWWPKGRPWPGEPDMLDSADVEEEVSV